MSYRPATPTQLSSLTSHSRMYTTTLHGNIPDSSVDRIHFIPASLGNGEAGLRPAGARAWHRGETSQRISIREIKSQ